MRLVKITTLPKASESWIDRDTIMLHSCFQILVDCVEKEGVDTHCNYEAHKEFVDEVRFLYQWWKIRSDRDWKLNSDDEDDEMLLRLMTTRKSLWT